MLEIFFDYSKVFSFFEALLKSGKDEINCFELLFNLGVPEDEGAEILQSFVFLGILSETDRIQEGIFEFNPFSKVVLGLCFFDEFIGNYAQEHAVGKGGGYNISFEDFVKFIENNAQEVSIEEMMDILNGKGSL